MGLAEASASTIFIGKSTALNVAPAGTYKSITPTGHSIEPGAVSFQGEDIDPSGLAIDTFRTTISGRGDVNAHWRPSLFDETLESLFLSSWTAALAYSGTVSFAAPSATTGIQRITDDGVNGFALATVKQGMLVLIGGAIANALNAGLKIVHAVDPVGDYIDVYNPTGAVSAADAGVTIAHAGTMVLGTTKSWLWIERVFNDGSINVYTEWYKNCLAGNWNLQFPAAGPTRVTLSYQGDAPSLAHIITTDVAVVKQRGGTDAAASTARLVHGMDDVREIVFSSVTSNFSIAVHDLCSVFEFTVNRNIRQDPAVGTSLIINTSPGRAALSGRVDAFLTSVLNGPSKIAALLLSNPDDLQMHVIFGATDATCYGVFFKTVRVTGSPVPVPGNDQAVYLNGAFSAREVTVTRMS